MKKLILYIFLASSSVLWSCREKNNADEGVVEAIPTVITVRVEEKEYTPSLHFSGTVFANRESNLGAALPGKVERIFFAEGERVKQGELIVELSDEMLTQAEVENQALKKDYERVKRLREKGSISEMEYDHIKAKLEASNAKTEMIRKNTRVFAPFSGTIVERMMEEGEIFFINPGLEPGYSMRSGIVRLMQLDPVRVRFDLNEKDLALVKENQNVIITLDAHPDKKFSGRIASIKPMLSTMTRTTPAEVILSNPNGELKPGMFARVTVELPKQKALFVPMNCISRTPGTSEDFVLTIENGKAKRKSVVRVTTLNDLVAVTGLQPSDTLIADGKSRIVDGQRINLKASQY